MPEVVRTVGRYGILSELGRGGMGTVWLAWQGDLDRQVALKELSSFHANDPMFARRFVRESRLAGSLQHANIVTVFDFFEHDGVPYIAMEYVERGSLRPYVGTLTLAQIGGVLDGLLAGLEGAAERGIVHRDLKPENVMVGSDGGVKIADFGIAKATAEVSQTSVLLTQTGAAVGTPQYMSPEQAMAQDIGPYTDLYALGCIAYELVTGKPPFHDAKTPMAALVRHVNERLPPAADVVEVAPELSAWIERLTEKDPGDRPASAAEAREALEDILVDEVGALWRRQARLPERPVPLPPGPATPPPRVPSGPVEGIDLTATGPDTPLPEAPGGATPPASTPVVGTIDPLARFGAFALLVSILIPVVTGGLDRWNLFAVLSPFEAVGVAWLVLRRPSPGVLVAGGALTTVAAGGLIKFTLERLSPVTVVFAVIALAGAMAILVAGLRSMEPERAIVAVDPATLLFGLAGTALLVAALFVDYDGFSSLWSEVGEGESAEFFFLPALAVVGSLAGLALLGTWARFAAQLLTATGLTAALHFLGVIVAAALAVGERGDVKAAGFLGVLGGLLVLVAGAYAGVRQQS